MTVSEVSSLAKAVVTAAKNKRNDAPPADPPKPSSGPTADAADGADQDTPAPESPAGGSAGATLGNKVRKVTEPKGEEPPPEPPVVTEFEPENPASAPGATAGDQGEGARLGVELLDAESQRDQARDQVEDRQRDFEDAAGTSLEEIAGPEEQPESLWERFGSPEPVTVDDISHDELAAAVDARVDEYSEDRELTEEQLAAYRAKVGEETLVEYAELVAAQDVLDEYQEDVSDIRGEIRDLNEEADEIAEDSFEAADEFAREYGIELTGGDDGLELEVSNQRGSSFFRPSENLIQISRDSETGVHKGLAEDNVYHEYGHAVVHSQTDLDSSRPETGAISESLADTYAAMIDTDDWFITEDAVPGGIRDMTGETSGDPTSVDDLEDGQGIHTAAGVPNRAAYLIGEELGRDAMADIYMDTIQNHLDEDMTFADLASGTIESAESLYGEGSDEAEAVREAWNEVGLSDDQIESGDAVIGDNEADSDSGDSDNHGHEH